MKTTTVVEGVDKFPENEAVIEAAHSTRPREYLSADEVNPYYHGPNRQDCLLVKYRREKTYDDHFLDIYKCLTHDKETCRCGMEWAYYQEEKYLDYVRS